MAAARQDLPASTGATVIAALALRAGSLADPRWRINLEWSQELIPAFISGGFFILVTGAGILWIIRFFLMEKLFEQHPELAEELVGEDFIIAVEGEEKLAAAEAAAAKRAAAVDPSPQT